MTLRTSLAAPALALSMALAGGAGLAGTAAAEVGNTYVTAYSRTTGTQVKAGKYGTQMLLRTKTQLAGTRTTKDGRKVATAAYDQEVSFCKRTYYTTQRGKSWLAAHRRARHVLVVRYHAEKGKYRNICGTPPKPTAPKKGS